MSLNKVTLLGNVGQEPAICTTQDGKKIATFSLATTEKWKDKNGEKQQRTEWHRVVVYNDALLGVVEKYVKKGTKLFVEGSLATKKWTDKQGVEKYTTEVILQGFNNKLEIIDNRNFGENQEPQITNEPNGIEDDIPF